MEHTAVFDYDRDAALELRETASHEREGVASRLLIYRSPFGERRVAEVIRPAGAAPRAAILYVHWYEPESHDSNRSQFHHEAVAMAQRGVVSLLIETMWSDRDWFLKRMQANDRQNTIRQVIELRQALDLLLAQPGVPAERLAYVGHDFGAMYGVLMGKIDRRPTSYVLMAGTPRFPDWYLYYPRLEGAEREAYIAGMAPFDPIAHVAELSPAPLLFQFGHDDPHVPDERAQEFFQAAAQPKQIAWYDAGHGLNEAAAQERTAWLARQLGLSDT